MIKSISELVSSVRAKYPISAVKLVDQGYRIGLGRIVEILIDPSTSEEVKESIRKDCSPYTVWFYEN
jgi:hypothetical protein